MNFSQSKTWKKYLHYDEKGKDLSRMEADSPFFLSKNGANNAYDELVESIAIFQNPAAFLTKKIGHPVCLFPYRLKLLKKNFPIPDYSHVKCPAYQMWKKNTENESIEIVFASHYLGNPASVMGHTFLKFRSKTNDDYLSLIVGFGADVPESTSTLRYVTHGLMGKFQGAFVEGPYYQKIFEYNNMELRDLWEYKLTLSDDERENLADHLWELKNTSRFRYYFFDRNCSYVLLDVINSIVPQKNFLPKNLIVLPHETLKILKHEDLIESEKYVPSLQTKLKYKFSHLKKTEQFQILDLIKSENLTGHESQEILDVLIDVDLFNSKKKRSKLDHFEINTFAKEVLNARSKYPPTNKKDEDNLVQANYSPLLAHPMHQLRLEEGVLSFGNIDKSYHQLMFSPGVHKFMDKSIGFLPNSNFSFFTTELRNYHQNNSLIIQSFEFFNVSVLNPMQLLMPRPSYALSSAWSRGEYSKNFNAKYYHLNFLVGGSVSPSDLWSFNLYADLEQQYFYEKENKSYHSLWGAKFEFIFENNKIKFYGSQKVQRLLINGNDKNNVYTSTLKFRVYELPKNNSIELGGEHKNYDWQFASSNELRFDYIVNW
ncbi:MAG: DUF4105 domain-containing protein [Bacteriovoracaceae bacterium]|nr:DUF4105 domain-containing protein [Bacteriovoracaceae bacterium]